MRFTAICVTCLILAGSNEFDYTRAILWDQGLFQIEASYKVEQLDSPKLRYSIETKIEDGLTAVFLDALATFKVESYYTVNDYMSEYPQYLNILKDLSLEGHKMPAYFSDDFKYMYAVYNYDLYGKDGIISAFVTHTRPNPVRSFLGFIPTNVFSGIAIYAKGEFKAYAKDLVTSLTPAFFPKIYDEDLNLVLDKKMCYPENLKQWGMVFYGTNEDLEGYQARIGDYPLRLIMRQIYGKYNTDLIIAADDANRILALEENRELMRKGKIVIIID